MKYCPITPTSHLGQLPITGGRFCFAELALRDTVYANFHRIKDHDDDIVVMDTFIYEGKGGFLSDLDLIAAVTLAKPTHLVVPDVPGDAQATIARFVQFHEKWQITRNPSSLALLGVIQGRNVAEMVRCARILGALTNWLAIPTRMPLDAPRSKLLDSLINDAGFQGHSFHLLGQAQQGFEDDVRCADFRQVKSLDSKKAVSAARQGLDLNTLAQVAQGVQEEIREKGHIGAHARIIIHSSDDFFECHLDDRQLELARKNVIAISDWLR